MQLYVQSVKKSTELQEYISKGLRQQFNGRDALCGSEWEQEKKGVQQIVHI